MKAQISLLFAIGLFSLAFTGCQKADIVKPLTVADEGNFTLRSNDCCVPSLPSEDETVYTNATFGITVVAHNDATTTYVKISRAAGNMTIRYANPGIDPTQTNGPTIAEEVTMHSLSFANPSGWECGDPVTFSFYLNGLGGGTPNTLQTGIITYNLKDVCGCENSLTAEVNCTDDECNRSVTFSFTPEEDGPIVIQGGLTALTTICSATATGGLELNPDHQSAGGPSNVTRWEGDVVACETYTVTIVWSSTNSDTDITDEWTAQRGDETLASIGPLSCP